MFDIHVHSTFSHDGKSTISDYARYLRGNPAVEAIGLAEHVDFMPECGGYGTFDSLGYLAEAAKKAYADVRIYAGAEIDYSTSVESEIKAAINDFKYEYTIASVHIVNKIPFSTAENKKMFEYSNSFKDILEEYYFQIRSCLSMKKIDCIGHIGIFKRYMEKQLLDDMGLTAFIDSQEDILAAVCAGSGKIVEVNTSGYGSEAHAPFPDFDFLKKFFSHGGRRIALGSDSHNTDGVCRGFAETESALRKIGFMAFARPWVR